MAEAPYTRNWSALELSDLTGANTHISVNGEVEFTATNLVPKLALHKPQGINPRILMLTLTIEPQGQIGAPTMAFKPAADKQPTSGKAYDEVSILFDGKIIQRVKVDHPLT